MKEEKDLMMSDYEKKLAEMINKVKEELKASSLMVMSLKK